MGVVLGVAVDMMNMAVVVDVAVDITVGMALGVGVLLEC